MRPSFFRNGDGSPEALAPRGTAKDPAPLGADFVRSESERELRPDATKVERSYGSIAGALKPYLQGPGTCA